MRLEGVNLRHAFRRVKESRRKRPWGTVVLTGERIKISRLAGCGDTHLESQHSEGQAGQTIQTNPVSKIKSFSPSEFKTSLGNLRPCPKKIFLKVNNLA